MLTNEELQQAKKQEEGLRAAHDKVAKIQQLLSEHFGLLVTVSAPIEWVDGGEYVEVTILSPTGQVVLQGLTIIWNAEGRALSSQQNSVLTGSAKFVLDEEIALKVKKLWGNALPPQGYGRR